MGSEVDGVAAARMAAGALFVDRAGRMLLVRKTYGNRWDLPGGLVEPGESPTRACRRELAEELDLDRPPLRLLAVDWAPSDHDEGDKLLWVFDCGELGEDEHRIRLDGDELDHWQWVRPGELDTYLLPRLSRRVRQAHLAHRQAGTVYLEHGRAVLGSP